MCRKTESKEHAGLCTTTTTRREDGCRLTKRSENSGERERELTVWTYTNWDRRIIKDLISCPPLTQISSARVLLTHTHPKAGCVVLLSLGTSVASVSRQVVLQIPGTKSREQRTSYFFLPLRAHRLSGGSASGSSS